MRRCSIISYLLAFNGKALPKKFFILTCRQKVPSCRLQVTIASVQQQQQQHQQQKKQLLLLLLEHSLIAYKKQEVGVNLLY